MQMLSPGLWPVMLTPFKENNEVDYEGLKRLTEFYLLAGANGLFANCLSSEMYHLTEEERYLITKTVMEAVDGKVSVIATGTFGQDVKVNSDFIGKLYDLGVAAVVVNTSQLNTRSQDENTFNRKLEELLNRTQNIPLGLYECPQPYKRLLSVAMMKTLAQTGRFLYHKDTSCDLTAITQKINAVKGTCLGFFNAHTPTSWDSLKAGGSGLSPIAANFYPELFSYLIHQWQKPEKREDLHRLDAFLKIGDEVAHCFYPFSAKIFLKKRGLKINANTRIPLNVMRDQEYLKIDALLKMFNDLAEKLGIDTLHSVSF